MAKLEVTIDGSRFVVELSGEPGPDGGFVVLVDGAPRTVRLAPSAGRDGLTLAMVDGQPLELALDHELRWVQSAQGRHSVELRDVAAAPARPQRSDGRVRAPIPGTIVRLLATPGQQLAAGQPIVALEAMKMQNEICAPRAGLLNSLRVQPGQSVGLNEIIAEIGEQ
jgi:biotin carboxyl carrier protein